MLACGLSCRAGYGHAPRTGTLRGAGGSDSRPGPVQSGPVRSGFHAALIYGLSKQRIDPRLPAWAGGFESGKYRGVMTVRSVIVVFELVAYGDDGNDRLVFDFEQRDVARSAERNDQFS